MKALDLQGQRFGRLRVLQRSGATHGYTAWLCRCECGRTLIVESRHLVRGGTRSCGCYSAELNRIRPVVHGQSASREYHAWESAKQRCSNPKNPNYQNYGERGIRMCDRWINSFEAFIADMGLCPHGNSLDRLDNDGPYAPGNCRWATSAVQANNKRSNRVLNVGGERMTVSTAARRVGMRPNKVVQRLRLGWSSERALGLTTNG